MRFKKESYTHGMELAGKNEAAEVYFDRIHLVAAGFFGKRNKPEFHVRFKDSAQMEAYKELFLDRSLKSFQAHETRKTEQKIANKKAALELAEKLVPGTIVVTSWGYDQTNREFYEVLRRSGQSVVVRELAALTTETGMMSGHKVPVKGTYCERSGEMKIIIRQGGILVDGHYATIWDGEPAQCSWYA